MTVNEASSQELTLLFTYPPELIVFETGFANLNRKEIDEP